MEGSKPMAKALRAFAKALSNSSARKPYNQGGGVPFSSQTLLFYDYQSLPLWIGVTKYKVIMLKATAKLYQIDNLMYASILDHNLSNKVAQGPYVFWVYYKIRNITVIKKVRF